MSRFVNSILRSSAAGVQLNLRRTPITMTTARQFSKVGSRESIPPYPEKVPFGLTGLSILIAPFIYVGGMFSKKAASLLEDYDIFVPEDDDD